MREQTQNVYMSIRVGGLIGTGAKVEGLRGGGSRLWSKTKPFARVGMIDGGLTVFRKSKPGNCAERCADLSTMTKRSSKMFQWCRVA